MDKDFSNQTASATISQAKTEVCSVCHQPVKPEYYFCPNCGNKLHSPPLSTSTATQIGIYFFSLILPMIAFLAVSKWPGLKYLRSNDSKAKQIGVAAFILLALSTVFTVWYAVTWTQNYMQETIDSINADFGA